MYIHPGGDGRQCHGGQNHGLRHIFGRAIPTVVPATGSHCRCVGVFCVCVCCDVVGVVGVVVLWVLWCRGWVLVGQLGLGSGLKVVAMTFVAWVLSLLPRLGVRVSRSEGNIKLTQNSSASFLTSHP